MVHNYVLMADNCQTVRALHVVRPAEGGMRRHLELLCTHLRKLDVNPSVIAPKGFTLRNCPETSIYTAPITARPHPLLDLRAAAITAGQSAFAELIHGHGLRG